MAGGGGGALRWLMYVGADASGVDGRREALMEPIASLLGQVKVWEVWERRNVLASRDGFQDNRNSGIPGKFLPPDHGRRGPLGIRSTRTHVHTPQRPCWFQLFFQAERTRERARVHRRLLESGN